MVFEKFPWKKDLEMIEEAGELFEKRQYENWVIFRFGCELGEKNIDDVDLIFRGQEYPDAILLIFDEKGNVLKGLYVEFEENSSSFKGHDPEKCDLIVCARHDWNNKFPNEKCPLPVYVIGGKYFPIEE